MRTLKWLAIAGLCVLASALASRAQIVTRVVDQIVATTCAANNWVNAVAAGGTATCAQPATTNLSDVTAATTWTPTDASPDALAFTSVSGNFSKGNKTCAGTLRVTYPTTASVNTAKVNLPCTLANNGNMSIGSCWSTAPGVNGVQIMLAIANTATAQFINTSGGAATPQNSALSTFIVSCQFSFITT